MEELLNDSAESPYSAVCGRGEGRDVLCLHRMQSLQRSGAPVDPAPLRVRAIAV